MSSRSMTRLPAMTNARYLLPLFPTRFVNIRLNLRFVMVSVADSHPEDVDIEEGFQPDVPAVSLADALADVDVM